MTSLLQHRGEIGRKGVKLIMRAGGYSIGDPNLIEFKCSRCGRLHDALYTAWRKPVGMIGCWVQFRMNGEVIAPDLSVPMAMARYGGLPRDAEQMTKAEAEAYWHSEG